MSKVKGVTGQLTCPVAVLVSWDGGVTSGYRYHCSGHCLHLVTEHRCSLTQLRNVVNELKATCTFFMYCLERAGLLCAIVNKNVVDSGRSPPMFELCKTLRAERYTAFQPFYQCYGPALTIPRLSSFLCYLSLL